MKRTRIICFYLVLCLITFSIVGCVPEWVQQEHPISFAGSTWQSEDGRVQFAVALRSGDYHQGTIEKDGEKIEMLFQSSVAWNGMDGCAAEEYDAAPPDERGQKLLVDVLWYSDYREGYEFKEYHGSDHYFTAEVYESCIYEEGEVITFYRVDETKEVRVEEFDLAEYEGRIEVIDYEDFVLDISKDLETAVSQGKFALEEKYGSSSGELEVFYDCQEFCWLIKRNSSKLFGSTACILFQTNGIVLAVWEE